MAEWLVTSLWVTLGSGGEAHICLGNMQRYRERTPAQGQEGRLLAQPCTDLCLWESHTSESPRL